MKNMVVYCGSNWGENKAYYEAAQLMGTALVDAGYRLVYGGSNIGLMGTVADAVLARGGEVIGVIPRMLAQQKVAHAGLTELIETPDMTTRKGKMIELADGFIAMPGGLGTYEELFEVLSKAQLKLHTHAVGVLNVAGFFDPLLAMLHQTADAGFMPQANLDLLCHAATPRDLLAQMAVYHPRDAVKWRKPRWFQEAAK